jgi:hypothetical protein
MLWLWDVEHFYGDFNSAEVKTPFTTSKEVIRAFQKNFPECNPVAGYDMFMEEFGDCIVDAVLEAPTMEVNFQFQVRPADVIKVLEMM